jgi:hypothetical protein
LSDNIQNADQEDDSHKIEAFSSSPSEIVDGFIDDDDDDLDSTDPYSFPPRITCFPDTQEQSSQRFGESQEVEKEQEKSTICDTNVNPSLLSSHLNQNPDNLPESVDYKKRLSRKDRNWIYFFKVTLSILLLILLILIVILVIQSMQEKSLPVSEFQFPTASPTLAERDDRYLKKFAISLGYQEWNFAENSSYARAAKWIMEEDERNLALEDDGLEQRFLLAVFYFTTTANGQSPWFSCYPDFIDSSNVICQFQTLTNNSERKLFDLPKPSFRWLSKEHQCDWAGNQCDDSKNIRVIELRKFVCMKVTSTIC